MAIITTQQFLELSQVKDGVLVLKDKSLRGIMMVSSINFALKAEDDQAAIVSQFQNFLNSLDFSLEIFVQSRRLNITSYLDRISEAETAQANELLRIQTAEYRKFITELVAGGSIMNKAFYVIVPFYLVTVPQIGKKKTAEAKAAAPALDFSRSKSQLWQRMEFVSLGLRRCGLTCLPLNSLELIEFFWSVYHPVESEHGYFPEIPPELVQ